MISYIPHKFSYIFGLKIRWHSYFFLIGALVLFIYTLYEVKKKNLDKNEYLKIFLIMTIGWIVGARLLFYLTHSTSWSYFLNIININKGGLSSQGGLLALLLVYLYTKKRKINLRKYLDSFSPALLIGGMVARTGCLIRGDVYGIKTSVPWAFYYIEKGYARHPYAVYDMLVMLGAYLILMLHIKKKRLKDGLLFAYSLVMYFSGRFVIDFFRHYKYRYFGIAAYQVISALIVIFAILYIKNKKSYK